ncbi:MAG: transposase [Chloroflexi bacterium]|nr:transposase [Chloroflexota bacterium]
MTLSRVSQQARHSSVARLVGERVRTADVRLFRGPDNVVPWSPVQSERRLHTELCSTRTIADAIHQDLRGFRQWSRLPHRNHASAHRPAHSARVPGPTSVALDVHRAHVVGRCEAQTGILRFRRLVEQVMATAPYRQARRVFWIVDNGSSHRGARPIQRAKTWDPKLQLVHTPHHARWLDQIEIYFSIVQRKVLTPNDFAGPAGLADRLRSFERHFPEIGKPFEWTFTRDDLTKLLKRLDSPSLPDAA